MEEDAKMLANRIALLKLEETKAKKRVEEARKKSKSIIEKRERVEQRNVQVCFQYKLFQKIIRKERNQAELYVYQRKLLNETQERHDLKKRIKTNITENRKKEAKSVKQKSSEIKRKKENEEKKYIQKNQEKKTKIRVQEAIAQERIKQMKEKRLKDFKQNYDDRIRDEIVQINSRKKDLDILKQEEMEFHKRCPLLKLAPLLFTNSFYISIEMCSVTVGLFGVSETQ